MRTADGRAVQGRKDGPDLRGHTTGLGLENVRGRLALFYGQTIDLTLTSSENEGTVVAFALPCRSSGWRENDADSRRG